MTINRKDFLTELMLIKPLFSANETIPILDNICLNKGVLIATDLDQEYTSIINGLSKDIAITTNYKEVVRILKGLKDKTFSFELDDDLFIVTDTIKFKLDTLPVDDFPIMLGLDDLTKVYSLDNNLLPTIFKNLSNSISNESTRYYLNGINFDGVEFCATNGHTLSLYNDVDKNHIHDKESNDCIIPKNCVKIVSKIKTNENINLSCYKVTGGINMITRAIITYGNVTISTKVIDGTFPNYVQVMPKNNNKYVNINRKEFINNLVLLNSTNKVDIIAMHIKDNALSLENTFTKHIIAISDAIINADDLSIEFNKDYMLNTLKAYSNDILTIKFDCDNTPLTIEHDDLLTVIMPMRL